MMKINSLPLLFLLLLGAVRLAAQPTTTRTVTIPSGQEFDVIRNFITNDSMMMGLDVVTNTTYLLERGETYVYTTQWQPTYSINLAATEGEGARPRILASAPAAGEAPRFFRSVAAFSVRSIHFDGFDSAGNHTDNAPIRPRGAGTKNYVEDCYFTNHRQEICRVDADSVSIFFTDNIVENNYTVDNWAKNGGIMVQQGRVDTVIIAHNTFYNTPGRVTRNWTFDSEYVEFSNNTIVGAGGLAEPEVLGDKPFYDGNVEFGPARNLRIVNNIFYNMSFFGTLPEWEDEQGLFGYIPTDSSESIVISNNNIYTDPDLIAGTPDDAVQMGLMTSPMDTLYDSLAMNGMTGEELLLSENISEALTFQNGVINTDQFIAAKTERWSDPLNYRFSRLDLATFDDVEDLDFSYGTDAESYTAGTDGGPLGARRWFGDIDVSVPHYTTDLSTLRINANYPNPVESFTNLSIDLASPATVEVAIYDMWGRQVYRTNDLRVSAGNDQAIPLRGLTLPAGTYAYTVVATLEQGRRVGATRRMIVR